MITGATLAERLRGGGLAPLTDQERTQANTIAKKMHLATFPDDVQRSYEEIAEGYYAIGRGDVALKLQSLVQQLKDMRVIDKQPVYYMLKVLLLSIGRPEDMPRVESTKKEKTSVVVEEVMENPFQEPFTGEAWNFHNEELRGFTESESEGEDVNMSELASEAETESTPPPKDDSGIPLTVRDFVIDETGPEDGVRTLETEWRPTPIFLLRECLFLLQGLGSNIEPAHSGHVDQIVDVAASLDVLREHIADLEATALSTLSSFVEELVLLMRRVHEWLHTVEKAYVNNDSCGLAVSLNDFRVAIAGRLESELCLAAILDSNLNYKSDPALLLDALDDAQSRSSNQAAQKLYRRLYKAVLRDVLKSNLPSTASASHAYNHLLNKIDEARIFALGSNIVLPDYDELTLTGDDPDGLLLNTQVELRTRYEDISSHILSQLHARNVFSDTLGSLASYCCVSGPVIALSEWMVDEIIHGSQLWKSQQFINYELNSEKVKVQVDPQASDLGTIVESLATIRLSIPPTLIQSKGDVGALRTLWRVSTQVKVSMGLLSRSENLNLRKKMPNMYLLSAYLHYDVCVPLWKHCTDLSSSQTLEKLLSSHTRVMIWLKKHMTLARSIEELLLRIEQGEETETAIIELLRNPVVTGTCLELLK